ncbi:MAG: aminodeoxychorismate lyase [Pseudomonadales bacterium]
MPGDSPLWQGGADLQFTDRALQYGDGLFETIGIHQGRAWLLDLHLLRLARGIARLGLTWPDEEQLHQVFQGAQRACEQCSAGVLKLTVSAGGRRRGYGRDSSAASRVRAALYETTPLRQMAVPGLRLYQCQTQLAQQPKLAGIKHLNRLEQVLAAAEWDTHDYDEGLMLDSLGNVAEATASNIIYAQAGRLHTPALQQCGVHGVLREALLERMQPAITLAELAANALSNIEGLWLCNSVQGLRQVASIRTPSEQIRLTLDSYTAQLNEVVLNLRSNECFAFGDPRLQERLRSHSAAAPLLSVFAGRQR